MQTFTLKEPEVANLNVKRIEYKLGGSNGDCWECVSHTRNDWGYPIATRNGQKMIKLSRYVYELINEKKIGKGLIVLHSCDNPHCINPSHLFEGTRADNVKDRVNKGRQAKGKVLGRRANSILSERDVYEIKHLLRSRIYTQKRIAEIYLVTTSAIEGIAIGKNWKHVRIEE